MWEGGGHDWRGVDNKVEGEAGAGDMGVYRWKGGAEAAPERERILYMRLPRVLATMVAIIWSRGGDDDDASK